MQPEVLPAGNFKFLTIMAKVIRSIFHLYITSAQLVPVGIPQYMQCTHHGLTLRPFFAASARHQFTVVQNDFLAADYHIFICIFHSDWKGTSHTVLSL